MNKKAKYNKIPFTKWKEKQPDWKNALIGHKILWELTFPSMLEKTLGSFIEYNILDYESLSNAFYLRVNSELGIWKSASEIEPGIVCILEESSSYSNNDDEEFLKKMKEMARKIFEEREKENHWPIAKTPYRYPYYPKIDNWPHITTKPIGPFEIWCGITS